MEPKVSVCRKGESIYLTVTGQIDEHYSSQELLGVMRQLLQTSLKCAAPGSQVTYWIKTRASVAPENVQAVSNNQR
jgi:hypothetical protein